jgi:hypothetical protein
VDDERSRLISAGGNNTPAAASADDKGPPLQPGIAFALHGYKKGVQIEVYDVPFHEAK